MGVCNTDSPAARDWFLVYFNNPGFLSPLLNMNIILSKTVIYVIVNHCVTF